MTLTVNRTNPNFVSSSLREDQPVDTPSPTQMAPSDRSAQAQGDHELALLYANALMQSAQRGQQNPGHEVIGPIPSQSTYGQYRQQLKALLDGPDFTRWAKSQNVDLSKPVKLFPPRAGKPGYAALSVKPAPPASGGVAASLHRLVTPEPSTKYFGESTLKNFHTLPLSWPLIMQATERLANGSFYVDMDNGRSVFLSQVASFYGETIPSTKESAVERASQLRQSIAFSETVHSRLNADDVLESQKQAADINNLYVFRNAPDGRFLENIEDDNARAERDTRLPKSHRNYRNPTQHKKRIKGLVERTLRETMMPIDSKSSYRQENGLASGEKVSLMRFIVDNGWPVPASFEEFKELGINVTAAIPAGPPNGNFSGALSWPVPLSHQDQAKLYFHPLQTLPGVEEHGVFKILTRNQNWDKTALSHPRRMLEEIVSSRSGKAISEDLQREFGAVPTPDSNADWLLAALHASLDKESVVDGTGTRNTIAGFQLDKPAYYGAPISKMTEKLAAHLQIQGKASGECAEAAAHLLLSRRAPAYLVKDIPDRVTSSCHSWVSLQVAVARLEAVAPGSTALMSYGQVMSLATQPPDSLEEQAIEYQAQTNALKDWGIAQGLIPFNAQYQYTTAQMDTVRLAFSEMMNEIGGASATFSTPMPSRHEMAKDNLRKEYGDDIDYELECFYSTKDDKGFHSLIDLYLQSGTSRDLVEGWSSKDARLPTSLIHRTNALPPINLMFDQVFDDYAKNMEAAIAAQVKHLISTLPLWDRRNIEFGKLDVFKDIEINVDNFRGVKKTQVPSNQAVMLGVVNDGHRRVYEVDLAKNKITQRHDLTEAVPGFKKDRQDMRAGYTYHEFPTLTPAGDFASSIIDEKPLRTAIPTSFASERSAYIAAALVKNADTYGYKEQAKGLSTFESRKHFYENFANLTLNLVPFYSAIKNFQEGNVIEGLVDLALDVLSVVVGLGAAGKGIKALKAGTSTFAAGVKTAQTVGRAALGVLNPLDGIGGALSKVSNHLKRGLVFEYKMLTQGSDIGDLFKGVKNIDASAVGTFKYNNEFMEGPSVFKNDNWYAYNPVTRQPYGPPLTDFIPSMRLNGKQLNTWTRASDPVREIDNAVVATWKRTVAKYRDAMDATPFEQGYKFGLPSNVPGLTASTTLEDLMKLAARDDITAQQVGVLVKHYDDIAIKFGRKGSARFFDCVDPHFGTFQPMPQVVYLSQTGQLSKGQSAALSRVMASAVAEGKEAQLLQNMMDAAAFPKAPESREFMQRLNTLQNKIDLPTLFRANQPFEQRSYRNMVTNLGEATTSKSIMIDSPGHAMAAGVKIDASGKSFYFYDPNHGLAKFSNAEAMEGALHRVFTDKQLGKNYKTHSVDQHNLEFKVFDHNDAWQRVVNVKSSDIKSFYEAPLLNPNTQPIRYLAPPVNVVRHPIKIKPQATPDDVQSIVNSHVNLTNVGGHKKNIYSGLVFRGDMRPPFKVAAADAEPGIFETGFTLRTPISDVREVSGTRGGFGGGHDALDPDGRGISTSVYYNNSGAGAYYYGGDKGGHTYVVDGRNMEGFHLYANRHAVEHPTSTAVSLKPWEINYGSNIPGHRIIGAFDSSGSFISNPGYAAKQA
ncbi:hypothetical protein [Pseudomonas orientalis]|uniref:Peptidase C58 YopT-type domain-containing protein n=1 Tax=Pseudomonas orientalis TaxID=76758 RepID=A0A2L0RWB9_9PSED|nr:hypothetical protein [Pseudomonas orientalis]AUZ46397.1 hypothetical protein BOP93_12595 [Pseudomonas orientalis]